jgi:hypothetical protein
MIMKLNSNLLPGDPKDHGEIFKHYKIAAVMTDSPAQENISS